MGDLRTGFTDDYFIDLRQLVEALWRGKWLLLGFFLVFTLGAGAVSLWVMPREYEASTLVSVELPRVPSQVSLYLPMPKSPDIRTLIEALSEDAVISGVASEEGISTETLRSHGRVETVGYHGIRLVVRDTDPQRAARLANRWAAITEDVIREMYNLNEMEAQWVNLVQRKKVEYLSATQQKRAFWTGEEVRRELTWGETRNYASFLSREQQALEAASTEVKALQEQLQGEDENHVLSQGVTERVWKLVTTNWGAVGSYSLSSATGGVTTFFTPPSSLTVGEALKDLNQVAMDIADARNRLSAMQSEIMEQVEQVGVAKFQSDDELQALQSQWANAWNTYVHLRQQEEWFRQMKRKGAIVHPISPAQVPQTPISPRTKVNIVLGALIGLTLGVTVVLLKTWWEKSA